MDAPEIEKLKALALAAIDKGTDGALQEFQGEALPEAVLALIAEVERLRAELATGAARQGGITQEVLAAKAERKRIVEQCPDHNLFCDTPGCCLYQKKV